MAIEFYKEFGDLGYLANYSNHGFVKDGVFYKTVEHYYQSQKFFDSLISREVIISNVPKEASNIGRDRGRVRKINFKNIKNQVMFEGVLEKFRQNRDIAYKLVGTRNEPIIEATVDEYYWGIGKNRTGLNVIGHILEEVREIIKYEILNDILKKCLDDDVYIIGHSNPDADSLISSYLLSKVLKSFGIEAHFAVIGDSSEYANKDSKLLSNVFKEAPVIIDDITDKKFIFVDHNNLGSFDPSQVLGAIDHHIVTEEIFDTIGIEYASTALLIYDLFKDSYEFTEEDRYLIGVSVLSDTDYLRSKRFTDEDRKLYESLKLNINEAEMIKEYYSLCDFNKSIQDNLKWDYKKYVVNGKTIHRSTIYSNTEDYINHFEDYVNYLTLVDYDCMLIWCDVQECKTYVLFDSVIYDFDGVISSTTYLMKKIENTKKNCYNL